MLPNSSGFGIGSDARGYWERPLGGIGRGEPGYWERKATSPNSKRLRSEGVILAEADEISICGG